ncbi:flavodoxin family protein [Leifsonia sp. NPDC058248]|uniref:flavodoxin family protein n=1 Tax=Leifsonia sp. NPDC058248 TaxID=3346402 RepID=UPI0036D9D5A8
MKTTVVYESMFGNTRQIAEAIADGVRSSGEVVVLPVSDAPESTADSDLLIVGAPTHTHGLSRPESRIEAGQWADDPAKDLQLEPNAEGLGVREWLASVTAVAPRFAAFDTRADIARLLSGSAAAKIEKNLHKLGSNPITASESYLVDKQSRLEIGELERAREWGRQIGATLGSVRL